MLICSQKYHFAHKRKYFHLSLLFTFGVKNQQYLDLTAASVLRNHSCAGALGISLEVRNRAGCASCKGRCFFWPQISKS